VKGYAEKHVFSEHEHELLSEAQRIVGKIQDGMLHDEIRCHELARGIGRILGLPHSDGHFGGVEHTWLWTRSRTTQEDDWWDDSRGWAHDDRPKILDVYFPGVMPQVVLIDTWCILPYWKFYRIEETRSDIDTEIVNLIVSGKLCF
jgi:hypothetical protein